MIDEKKLTEDLLCKMPYQFGAQAMDWFRNLIEEQPKIGGWILCSERMPEENQKVIACFAHGTVTELQFYDGRFHGIYSYDEKVIIAWMPLPEPYKPEKEEPEE